MSGDYDPKEVNLYITEVMAHTAMERMALWTSIVYKMQLVNVVAQNTGRRADEVAESEVSWAAPYCPLTLLRRFYNYKNQAVQANILFRFGPIVDKIVRGAAKNWAAEARSMGDM